MYYEASSVWMRTSAGFSGCHGGDEATGRQAAWGAGELGAMRITTLPLLGNVVTKCQLIFFILAIL